jgi:osmotically-inducible protein OsmY
MNRVMQLLGGIGIGSGLMYLYDPQLGRRRRSLVRDQFVRAANELQCGLDKGLRDLENRAEGFVSEFSALFDSGAASDRVLSERIRATLGRYVSHPRALAVEVHDGCATLSGPILANEVESAIEATRGVRGIHAVENQLEVHQHAGNVSALQGGVEAPGERWNIAEGNWAPGTRLSLIVAGGALMFYGLTQRFPTACILGSIGLGTCVAAFSPQQQSRSRQVGQRLTPKQGAVGNDIPQPVGVQRQASQEPKTTVHDL